MNTKENTVLNVLCYFNPPLNVRLQSRFISGTNVYFPFLNTIPQMEHGKPSREETHPRSGLIGTFHFHSTVFLNLEDFYLQSPTHHSKLGTIELLSFMLFCSALVTTVSTPTTDSDLWKAKKKLLQTRFIASGPQNI